MSIKILNNSLNATRCGKLFNSEMNTYSQDVKHMSSSVKMSLTRRQSAWVINPSETKRSAFFSNKCSASIDFSNWLVGITDGDGCFYFEKNKKGNWSFSFQISQSSYNLRLLHRIKAELQLGSIIMTKKDQMAVFLIRNKVHLINKIIPLFDAHQLLTSKNFKYQLFKKSLLIANNPNLNLKEKDSLISRLKIQSTHLPEDYISPVWADIANDPQFKNDVVKVMKKAWLVGFVEAEGSFYITKKTSKRLVHAFEITQKHDPIVLEAIAVIFKLKVTKKKTYNTIVTTNTESIKQISDYFFKTMKGMKSLEYRIWARSFNKKDKNLEYLFKIRNLMRNIRSIRYNKYYKKAT